MRGWKALVIGGTGGLGAETAVALAERGADLVVHGGSSEQRLARTLERLRATGASAEGFLRRIGDGDRVSAVVDDIVSRCGDPDIVVCAWGPFERRPLEECDAEFWDRSASLLLAFPGAVASAYLKGMAQRGRGRFLFFGGTGTDGIRGFFTTAAYSAAKTALGSLAKSISWAYADKGVGAVVLCPGFCDTEYLDEAERRALKLRAPAGRLQDPRALGLLAASLVASQELGGSVVSADSGLFLGFPRV